MLPGKLIGKEPRTAVRRSHHWRAHENVTERNPDSQTAKTNRIFVQQRDVARSLHGRLAEIVRHRGRCRRGRRAA